MSLGGPVPTGRLLPLPNAACGNGPYLKRDWLRTQTRRTFVFGQCKHVVDQLAVGRLMVHVASREHALLSCDCDFWGQQSHLSQRPRVVYKTGNVCCCQSVDHAGDADCFAREDAGVDRRFCVVTNNTADKLHARGDLLVTIGHVDFAVSIFKVAVASSRTQVDPAS